MFALQETKCLSVKHQVPSSSHFNHMRPVWDRAWREEKKQTVEILFHHDGVAAINYVNIYSGVTGQRDPEALPSNFPPFRQLFKKFFFFGKSQLISLSVVLAGWKSQQRVGIFNACGFWGHAASQLIVWQLFLSGGRGGAYTKRKATRIIHGKSFSLHLISLSLCLWGWFAGWQTF